MIDAGSEASVREAAAMVRGRLADFAPVAAIVLGSGLGEFRRRLGQPVHVPYADIPHFPLTTVAGHGAELVAGWLGGRAVIVQCGRLHMYEGHSADVCAMPVRIFAALGVDTLIVTNAAGAVRSGLGPGTLMMIADHINLTGRNPLVGRVRSGEERFPDMSDAYDATLRATAQDVARRRNIPLVEGVYAGLLGPSYETPAEVRMLECMGADAVGMSTVIEVIAARACGLRCLGLSAIANVAVSAGEAPLSHAAVLAGAAEAREKLGDLIEGLMPVLPSAIRPRG